MKTTLNLKETKFIVILCRGVRQKNRMHATVIYIVVRCCRSRRRRRTLVLKNVENALFMCKVFRVVLPVMFLLDQWLSLYLFREWNVHNQLLPCWKKTMQIRLVQSYVCVMRDSVSLVLSEGSPLQLRVEIVNFHPLILDC